ncbi:MAG: hypothetical protein JKY48_12385 [Flavobacteriales bacterium]|nr:hypothetical protein [Flavobacteriales bacterium]
MTKRIMLLQVLMSFGLFLLAQDKGKLQVYTKPPEEAVIKLGEQYLSYGKFIELDTGTYNILAWAPGRELIAKTVKITAGGLRILAIKLPYSEAYKTYKRRHKGYQYKKYGLKYGALTAYGVVSVKFLIDIFQLEKDSDKHSQEAKLHQQSYSTAVYEEDIIHHQLGFKDHQSAYNDNVKEINQRLLFIQAGAVLSVVATYFTRKGLKNLKEPGFRERPRLSKLQVIPSVSPYAQSVGLQIQF